MESASGRSTAATTALLPRSRHPTTEDGGCAHGPARRGAPRRGEAAVASNSSQTSAKVSVYPSALHCIIIGNSDELQKDEKRPELCLNSVATSIIFTRRFTASLDHFSNISTIFSPPLSDGLEQEMDFFLSQNTGRTEWLLRELSDRTPHMRILTLILFHWAENQSQILMTLSFGIVNYTMT